MMIQHHWNDVTSIMPIFCEHYKNSGQKNALEMIKKKVIMLNIK